MKLNCKCICLEDACRPDAEQEDELFFEDDGAAPIANSMGMLAAGHPPRKYGTHDDTLVIISSQARNAATCDLILNRLPKCFGIRCPGVDG